MTDVPAMRYGFGKGWWFIVGLGVLAALASAAVGGGGGPEGAFLAIALNPLVWLGAYAFFRTNAELICPHCQRGGRITEEFRNAPIGSVGSCRFCNNAVRKAERN